MTRWSRKCCRCEKADGQRPTERGLSRGSPDSLAALRCMSAIEASGLTKVYRTYRKESGLWGSVKGLVRRKYDETRAADDVSFTIEEGELVGFLGPNGAGKTTVLKMLSGLLNPDRGRSARARLRAVGAARRNEAAIQPAHGPEKRALVGPARAGIARAQPRDLRDRSRPVQESRRRPERAARGAATR